MWEYHTNENLTRQGCPSKNRFAPAGESFSVNRLVFPAYVPPHSAGTPWVNPVRIKRPHRFILASDGSRTGGGWNYYVYDQPQNVGRWHNGGFNVLFADYHVEFFRDIQEIMSRHPSYSHCIKLSWMSLTYNASDTWFHSGY